MARVRGRRKANTQGWHVLSLPAPLKRRSKTSTDQNRILVWNAGSCFSENSFPLCSGQRVTGRGRATRTVTQPRDTMFPGPRSSSVSAADQTGTTLPGDTAALAGARPRFLFTAPPSRPRPGPAQPPRPRRPVTGGSLLHDVSVPFLQSGARSPESVVFRPRWRSLTPRVLTCSAARGRPAQPGTGERAGTCGAPRGPSVSPSAGYAQAQRSPS